MVFKFQLPNGNMRLDQTLSLLMRDESTSGRYLMLSPSPLFFRVLNKPFLNVVCIKGRVVEVVEVGVVSVL